MVGRGQWIGGGGDSGKVGGEVSLVTRRMWWKLGLGW
jgi:hypothetical protein